MKKENNILESLNKIKKDSFLKACFHEDENCSNKIIKAHSIQNNRILNTISENGEVLMIGGDIDNSSIFKTTMEHVGRKRATTFTGFCGKHDTDIFIPIERENYQLGNKEQEFLFAYRALAKEYHSKLTVGDMFRKMQQYLKAEEYHKLSDLFDEQNPLSLEHIENMAFMFRNYLIGSKDAEDRLTLFKKRMNIFLDNSNFDEIITEVIEFDEEYHIAVSSMTFIEKDLNDKIVNEMGNLDMHLAPLFITVFPQDGKTYVLLSYFERNKRKYKFIKEQIITQNIQMQKIIISNLIVAYLENWTISPIKWSTLSEKMKKRICKHYNKTVIAGNRSLLYDKNMNLFI
ncbi:hypothetical protein [Bacillus mycoides]|uniref:hypothetical protein n=1 Tax=Bacillus mycoides TaxID=1405 RepID=UPI000B4A9FC1|nr:hypothetical protein [Bacillus mycoides]